MSTPTSVDDITVATERKTERKIKERDLCFPEVKTLNYCSDFLKMWLLHFLMLFIFSLKTLVIKFIINFSRLIKLKQIKRDDILYFTGFYVLVKSMITPIL